MPFIFGRGGEELETLCNAGIPFSVSSRFCRQLLVALPLRYPLTHRDYARACA
ncbi:hypothetical protein ACLK19_22485 [Escherichia coli]